MDSNDSKIKEDNNILHLRINPSSRTFDKNSVESIIFVESDDYSTVWCAVGNRIKIFDSTTWTYETSDIKLKDKIVLKHFMINNRMQLFKLYNYKIYFFSN